MRSQITAMESDTLNALLADFTGNVDWAWKVYDNIASSAPGDCRDGLRKPCSPR